MQSNYSKSKIEIVDKFEFRDQRLKSYLSLYLDVFSNSEELNRTKAALKNLEKVIKTHLVAINIEEVNEVWLLNLFSKATKSDLILIFRIVIFLIENKVIINNRVLRLAKAKDRIIKRPVLKEVEKILNSNEFELFDEIGTFEDENSINFFFFSLKPTDFVETETYDFLCSFIEHYKINHVASAHTKFRQIQNMGPVLRKHFGTAKLSDVDSIFFMRILENVKTVSPYTHLIYFGIKFHYFDESKFCKLYNFMLNYSSKQLTKNNIFELLNSRENEHYFAIKSNNVNFFVKIQYHHWELIVTLKEFLEKNMFDNQKYQGFVDKFQDSLSPLEPKTPQELNTNTFLTQLQFYSRFPDNLFAIVNFYNFIYSNYNKNLFSDSNVLNIDILQRNQITSELLSGHKLVIYTPYECYPKDDKWILYYSSKEESNSAVTNSSSTLIDFTSIEEPVYKEWAKYFFWYDTASIYSKVKQLRTIRFFLNYVSDIKTGNAQSFFSKTNNSSKISTNDIVAYKNHVNCQFNNPVTRNHYIYDIRKFLGLLNDAGLTTIDRSIFYHLTNSVYNKPNSAKVVSNENLQIISKILKKKADISDLNKIYYVIFYILLETEFRISQVLTLEKDCIQEAYKSNQFVIKSKTKQSPTDKIEQPITIYVKRQIDEILKITEQYRSVCNRDLIKNHLFISPAVRKGRHKLITRNDFNDYLKICCQEANIPHFTTANLRDTHMTKSVEYSIRNSLSDLKVKTLTGHKNAETTSRHYVATEISTLLESVHGIIIGDVDVKGQIVEKIPNSITSTDEVSNHCGYCISTTCNDFTYLDCMLCNHFITCVDRIPYFEEQLRIISSKIESANTEHDVEDLRNIKVLLATYLKKLILLRNEGH